MPVGWEPSPASTSPRRGRTRSTPTSEVIAARWEGVILR